MDIDFIYPWLKIGHILLAIVAVGFNFTYGILIRRAAREPEHMGHVLRSVKVLDDRFATPAYILLPVLGVAMVFIGGYAITDLWIIASLALWAVVAVLGATQYSPTLRRQIASLDAGGAAIGRVSVSDGAWQRNRRRHRCRRGGDHQPDGAQAHPLDRSPGRFGKVYRTDRCMPGDPSVKLKPMSSLGIASHTE